MQIEVILNGKGSITLSQKVDLEAKSLKKLTTHCTELLKASSKHERFGFEAGTGIDAQIGEEVE